MIYFLFACFCVFFVFSWASIRRVAKHDGVLFPLCELRRDVIRFLYENVFENPDTLSRKEYDSVRRLLRALNDTIHNYNQHKTLLFNQHKIVAYLRKYRHTLKWAAPIELPDNTEIQHFHKQFRLCLVKAFIAYTPLIRSERFLRLAAHAYHTVYMVGKKERERRRQVAEHVVNSSEKVRNDARRFIGSAVAA